MWQLILRCIKYLLNKLRTRKLLRFPFSTEISLISTFEGANTIGNKCIFNGQMGYGAYMGNNNSMTARIGRFTSIGHNCKVFTGRHPYSYPFVSTSPIFYSLKKQCGVSFADRQVFIDEHHFADPQNKIHIEIGNDCWIQSDVSFVSGVKISDGAVILSGAVITKDVPPYAIVGGVPAKVLKYRYSAEDIQFLLSIQWWHRDISWIKENWFAFNDIDLFKNIIRNGNC